MKREYQAPTLNTQNFVPNESVAACYITTVTDGGFLVHCETHLQGDPGWNRGNPDPAHAGKDQWFSTTSADLLAAGASQGQLDHAKSVTGAARQNVSLTNFDFGGDGVTSHPNAQIRYMGDVTTQVEVPADGVNTVS